MADANSPLSVIAADYEAADKHHRIWRSVNRVKKLSDRVVGIGPFGVGLDGLLALVPIPGPDLVYTVGAGGFLMAQALRARASAGTLTRMVSYLALDAATSAFPFVGNAVDFLWPGQLMAATALQKDIERRHGPPPEVAAKLAKKAKPAKLAKAGRSA
jgi:Domain of unknown function (DUF4112)